MGLDGRTASLKARDYLVTMHGVYSIWEFHVEEVEFNEQTKTWVIICSFLPAMLAPQRLKYEVQITDEGDLRSAKKIKTA